MTTEVLNKCANKDVTRLEHTRDTRQYQPAVDIMESTDELTVVADMPGVAPEDVDIRFENGMLTIHGCVKPRGAQRSELMVQEYGVGDFHRTFQVSKMVDTGKISADMNAGVLTLHLPKCDSIKPRKISVSRA